MDRREASLACHGGQSSIDVIANFLDAGQEQDCSPGHGTTGRAEVHKVERASRAKHAVRFNKGPLFVRCRQVVEEEAGEDSIEGPIGMRDLIRHPDFQLDAHLRSGRLPPRDRQYPGVTIDANDPRSRFSLLDEDGQGRRATTEIQHVVPGPEDGLSDQVRLEPTLLHRKPNQRIVERRQPVEMQGGDVPHVSRHSPAQGFGWEP